jgi:hypothetical protein
MKRAGDFLSAIIDENLLNKVKTYSGFFSTWAEITQNCGIAAAAGHSRVRELERGIIVVEADHPGWVQRLQTKARWILQDARRRFPELDIRGISFTLSKPEVQRAGPEPPLRKTAGDCSGAQEPVLAAVAAPAAVAMPTAPIAAAPGEDASWKRIEDDEFKGSLKRLEESIKEREKRRS